MATVEQCRAALDRLAARIAEVDGELRARHVVERTISCTVPDLATTFHGRLADEGLVDIKTAPAGKAPRNGKPRSRPADRPQAQIRLTVDSDDLIALTQGEMGFAQAWARGRVRIEASVLDLLRLRSML